MKVSLARRSPRVLPARRLVIGSSSSFICVIRGKQGLSKIGVLTDLVTGIGKAGGTVPMSYEYIVSVDVLSASTLEGEVHAVLETHRVSDEWFDCSPAFTVAALGAAALRLGIAITTVPVAKLGTVYGFA